jgi:hypothetical protein
MVLRNVSEFVVVLAISSLFGAGAVQASSLPTPTVEYSADRVIESESGTFSGKVFATKDKERTESSMKGMQTITILRRDKHIGWMLMPMHHMYNQMDLGKAQQQSGATPSDQVDIQNVGTETVEGHTTTKYKMLMKDGDAGGFIWITEQGIAIKMDMLSKSGKKKTRMTITLTNLQIGPQDAQLFELPSGYSAMPSMGNMGAAFGGGR